MVILVTTFAQDLKSFTASQMLVSNAEFLEFVEAGGYKEEGRRWWSEEGWRYVQDLQVQGPRFWVGQTHCRMLLQVSFISNGVPNLLAGNTDALGLPS